MIVSNGALTKKLLNETCGEGGTTDHATLLTVPPWDSFDSINEWTNRRTDRQNDI